MMISTQLSNTLTSMLPFDIACAGGTLDVHVEELFEAEKRAVQAAISKRRRELAAGRSYARMALMALGCLPQPLPVGPAREVIWPSGFIGSISHSDTSCAAIVARTDDYCGIGIDLESDGPIEDEGVRAMICRPEERTIVCGKTDLSKLIFVIKEAVFKAYYPGARRYLEFADLSVQLDGAHRSFRAQLVQVAAPPLHGSRDFSGAFGFCDGQVIATIAVPRLEKIPA